MLGTAKKDEKISHKERACARVYPTSACADKRGGAGRGQPDVVAAVSILVTFAFLLFI